MHEDHYGEDVESLHKKILSKKRSHKKAQLIISSLLGIIIFFFVTTVYYYSKYQDLLSQKEEQVAPSLATEDGVIDTVGKHISLPFGKPSIAQVNDASKLKDTQYFFKDVANGDIVLVYPTAIILYRPSLDKLIAVGDISGQTAGGR
jgi:hypothetical protein